MGSPLSTDTTTIIKKPKTFTLPFSELDTELVVSPSPTPAASTPEPTPAAGTPEASWLTEWRQGQTAETDTMKAGYEADLTKEVTPWEDLAKSSRWLSSEEYQNVVAAKSYDIARKQEIADWYKEQTTALETQGDELKGVQQLQENVDLQSTVLTINLNDLNTELQKPTSLDAVQAKASDFVTQVEKQRASLTAYRDWLRAQGTTAEAEIAQAKTQGLPEDQWVSTDDRIRDLDKLIQWAADVQVQASAKSSGPTWRPWTSQFWRERALGFMVNTALPKLEWVDTTWSIFAAQSLQRINDSLPGDYGLFLGKGEQLFGATGELMEMENGKFVLKPWEAEAHEIWKATADPAAQSTLAILNPAWFIPLDRVGQGTLKGLEAATRGGKVGGEYGGSLLARLALRGKELDTLATEAGLELRGFKNVVQITGRTPGLIEHYLPQIVKATQIGVRTVYLPVEAVSRITLQAIHIAGALGKGLVAFGWKLATLPFKVAGWVFSRAVWRPAISQLGKLAIPESMRTLATNSGFEVSFLPKGEKVGKGMLYRVKEKVSGLDVLVKDEDEFISLVNTGELMPVARERFFVEQTGQVLSHKQYLETPVAGNIWAERSFRLATKPDGMSTDIWKKGFQAFRVDSMKKMVEPVQMMDQFPTIEKFIQTAPAETPLRRVLATLVNKEWAQGHMRGVPGLRRLIMSLDPVASDIARAAQGWRNMQEALEMWKTGQLAAARRCERFEVQVLKRDIGKGETITDLVVKNVQARDNKSIAYIGDALEHPERFVMSDELRVARDIYCQIIDEARAGLQKYGVDVKELIFEGEGHYFPRYVLGKNGNLINASGPRPGGGFMTKATFEKTRVFDEMSEGIQKGYIYEGDPLIVLDAHLSASIKRMADQEFYRMMKPYGMTEVEIVERLAPGLRAMADAGKVKLRAMTKIDEMVKLISVVEPHSAFKGSTMRFIRKYAPDVWSELRSVRTQATAEEKALRSTLERYGTTFKEMKWRLESLQSAKVAAEGQAVAATEETRQAIEELTRVLNELAEKPLAQFPTEEKLRDILALLPDELKSEWNSSVKMLYDDASTVAAGYEAELETAIESLKDDPIYSRTVKYGRTTVKRVKDGKNVIEAGATRNVNLPGLLLKRSGKDAGMIPETITIEQYRSLYGKEPNQSILKQVGKEKRVMSEYAFDEIAEEFGISSDEFVRRINDYPRLQGDIWGLTRDSQMANEAAERLAVVYRVFKEDEAEVAAAIKAVETGDYAKPFAEVAKPKPEVPEVKLPTQEPGMPEAGVQSDIFGSTKVVRPEGKGEVVQGNMEDLAKYQEAMKGKPVEPTATAVETTAKVTPEPAATPKTGTTEPKPEATFTPRPEAPEVKPSKDWWDKVRLMAENRLKDARIRQARMEADLAAVRARAKHPDPFGSGQLFQGEKGMMVRGTYAFQGTWFPETVATAIEKQLGDVGLKWVRGISDVSGVARMLMTGLDFGGGMIQGLPVLLMRPDVWFDAQKEAFKSLGNPKMAYEYLNSPASREVIRETIVAGKPLVVNMSEFTETMGGGGLMGKLVSQPGLKQTARPVFERAALSFDTFGTVARIEMYKGLRPLAKTPQDLLDLIDFVNKMTGVRSGVVAGATQRQIEGSLLLFAPRYFRATVSLMFDVFRGGLKGQLARRMMGSMLAGGSLFYYGACKALGQEPNFDPRSSKFLTVEIGGSHIGFGSIWVSMARMFAGVVATASDKPGDLLKMSRVDNPLAKFIAGRLAPLTGSAMDIILGKTYIGENLESKDGFLGKNWAAIGKEVIARNLLPFWLDAQLNSNPRPGLSSVPAEMMGLRSWALQPWEKRNKLRDFYAMQEFGVTWEQLRQEKPSKNAKAAMASTWGVDAQKYLEGSHSDLASVSTEARQAVLKRGMAFDALYEEWSGQFVTENERVATLLQRASDEFKYNISLRDRLNAGDTTLTADEQNKAQTAGQIFRDTVGQVRDNHRYWREAIQGDTKYKEVYDQLDKWKEEGADSLEKQGITEYVGDRAYQAYISLMYEGTGLEDQFGKFDYDEYDRRKTEWLSTWGTDMWDYCQKRLSAGKEEPAIVSELRKARQTLKPYWEMQDKITQKLQGKYPQSDEEKQVMMRNELTNRINKISTGMGDLYAKDPEMLGSIWRTTGGKMWKGIIAKIRAQVGSDIMVLDTAVQKARDQMRHDNPDIDFYLRLFYDRKALDETEATSFLNMANPYSQSTGPQPSYVPLALSAAM